MTGAGLEGVCLPPDATMRQAIEALEGNGRGIVLVVDGEGKLMGTATDGDIRRAILGRMEPEAAVESFMHRDPVTAPHRLGRQALLALMQRHAVRQLPLIDGDGRPAGLVTLADLASAPPLEVPAVVMAGGRGTRLRPLTDDLPKALVPVGGRPMVERVLQRLAEAGLRELYVVTQHRAEDVERHLGDGSQLGLSLRYLREDRPMGTAGSLAALGQRLRGPFVVMNCDILTGLDVREMLALHAEERANMTVALKLHQLQVPFGVVEMEGSRIRGITEKPALDFFVNAGIYVLQPETCRQIPRDRPFDMTDLIEALLAKGARVVGFPLHEYWLDVGEYRDFQRGERDLRQGDVH